MPFALTVVSGLRAGERVMLAGAEVTIGRAPTSTLCLPDADVAWRHAVVVGTDGRWEVRDLRSGAGVYVNGLRVERHALEPGDQLAVGEALLVVSDAIDAPASEASTSLLQACAALFLFRGLAESAGTPQQPVLETQLLRLLGDLLPIQDAALVLGHGEKAMIAACREHQPPLPDALARALQQAAREGVVIDAAAGLLAAPLQARRALAGALAVLLRPEARPDAARHAETLTAIATLAGVALDAAQEVDVLRRQNALLEEQVNADTGIIGDSPAVRRLLETIRRAAPADSTVLILGESGTGKELVAHALHQFSARRGQPFVAINCAALTEALLESELFGHEKGAFTGAATQKKGKLELAQGGTVFLDEVGELAPALQAKLLRVIQEREFERVGGTRTLPLDVRLVAATNRDLAAEVREHRFREDLYHRLNVVALRTPPLRERREDIPLLARHFLSRVAARCRRRSAGLTPETERLLLAHDWPGNVRELENAIERAVVLGADEWVRPEDLPDTVLDAALPENQPGEFTRSLRDAKREQIRRAWAHSHGDYKEAARQLGIHPNSLLRLVRTLGLRDELAP